MEFGTYLGGSALFFSQVLRAISPLTKVLTVDLAPGRVHERVKSRAAYRSPWLGTTHDEVARHIVRARGQYPGPVFAILDSDHRTEHVLAEMITLRPILTPGDYLVVFTTQTDSPQCILSGGFSARIATTTPRTWIVRFAHAFIMQPAPNRLQMRFAGRLHKTPKRAAPKRGIGKELKLSERHSFASPLILSTFNPEWRLKMRFHKRHNVHEAF